MLEVIVVIVIVGSIIAIFGESLPQGRFWTIAKKTVLFIPYLILGIIMHLFGDFKNHRLGYVLILMIAGFICWGMYMGYKAGPTSPDTWDN